MERTKLAAVVRSRLVSRRQPEHGLGRARPRRRRQRDGRSRRHAGQPKQSRTLGRYRVDHCGSGSTMSSSCRLRMRYWLRARRPAGEDVGRAQNRRAAIERSGSITRSRSWTTASAPCTNQAEPFLSRRAAWLAGSIAKLVRNTCISTRRTPRTGHGWKITGGSAMAPLQIARSAWRLLKESAGIRWGIGRSA